MAAKCSDGRGEKLINDNLTYGDAYLAHYGVRGMKWGRRKKTSSVEVAQATSPIRKGPQEGAHPDAINAKTQKARAKKSGINALSNQDLETLLKRQDLEQKYAKLNPNAMQKGKKLVNEALLNSTKNVVQEQSKTAMNKGLDYTIDKVKEYNSLRR